MGLRVLSIYPTILTTRIALFDEEKETRRAEIKHDPYEIFNRSDLKEQNDLRFASVEKFLGDWASGDDMPDAVIGGALLPVGMPPGVYVLDDEFLRMMQRERSMGRVINHGALIASRTAEYLGIKAFSLVPFATDELDNAAKISGVPGLRFGRMTQTLHIKNAAGLAAADLGKPFSDVSLIIAWLGRNFSFAAHSGGRIRDFSNTSERGPFSLIRSGALPASELIRMAYSGVWSKTDLLKTLYSAGGLVSYTGTDDLASVMSLMESGDAYSSLVVRSMIYQISSELASMAVTLCGGADAIVLVGKYAAYQPFARMIGESVSWITGTLLTYHGDDELYMIARSALKVMRGEEPPHSCS
jgi:butyrate kinase